MSFVVMIVQSSMFESSKRRGHLRLAIGLGFFIGAATSLSAQQKTLTLTQRIVFHIPAQPLARALLAYGSATGFALYYNAEFAEGRRSRAVMQTLQPVEALDRLLEGTGLVPQITGPASFILIPAQRDVALRPTPGGSAPGPYESYFADIQKRIGAVLCSKATAGQQDEETFLQVWLATSGVISRVDLFTANGDGANRTDLVKALQGLSVAPPPSDMPQPVTLVVFPPNSAWKTCRSTDRALEAR